MNGRKKGRGRGRDSIVLVCIVWGGARVSILQILAKKNPFFFRRINRREKRINQK